ncbi:leucine-rich repeat protein [Lactobacillus sp. LC28-10]|uniref:Leucine-rich repeat protein n=1 Tax=Secundilactobacillus angelensis TaxID=2722706 RepID=A0ABX1KZX7_9LACO|nr:leucine-rich repeat protein [Secundilactobacillus angelensis]MCH5462902.1 leucine-rich repeat protein [Secundilactobacillus angelensis]NLR18720.1 leucine-rich repeat protein [Secundilactobacillus angelensis]
MGVLTLTLMTGFTLNITTAGAKTATATDETTQTTEVNNPSIVADRSEQTDNETSSQLTASNDSTTSESSSTTAASDTESSRSEMNDTSKQNSQSDSKASESKSVQQTATDVNGHVLNFETSDQSKSTDQSQVPEATSATTSITAKTTVSQDNSGNFWVPATSSQTAGDSTYTQLTDYSYSKNADGSTYTITGYTGDLQKYLAGGTVPEDGYATDITLPDTYNGDAVTAIADYAFDNESDHDQLQIVKALTKVTLGKNITTIGKAAFAGNDISGEVMIPNSVSSLGDDAYADNKITSVVFGNGMWFTGNGTFNNNQISHLDLGTGVSIIGTSTFANNQLTNLTLPDQVGLIYANAFQNNHALATLNIGQNSKLTDIRASAFESDALTTLSLPQELTNIGNRAFTDNQLISVSFDDNLQAIGTGAFANNQLTGLVTIPNSVVNIGDNAFSNNTISSLKLGTGVKTIGTSAFADNQIGGALIIPEGVINVGDNAFKNNRIDSLILGANVETIGSDAFANNQIGGTVTIPERVASIGDHAFLNNHINELILSKVDSGVQQTIATDAFAQNEISKVVNESGYNSADYLSNQHTLVSVTTQATSTQIQNIRSVIEKSVGITLPEDLIFIDSEGREWHYDATTDILTIPSGEITGDQVTFQFSSIGAGSYGTDDLVITLQEEKSASAPAVKATTTTINYQSPDGKIRGTATLIGNPGTPFDRYKVLEYVPAGWQLAIPISDLPQLIAQSQNQTVVIPLVSPNNSSTTPSQPNNDDGNPGGSTLPSQSSNGNQGTVTKETPSTVPNDSQAVQSNSNDDNGNKTITAQKQLPNAADQITKNQGDSDSLTDKSNKAHGMLHTKHTVQNSVVTTTSPTKVTTVHQTDSSATQLPQTSESASVKPTLIGGLLLSIFGWLGLGRRKHENN